MEQIITFLEQYWGLTIFGGLSLGTIATFVFVQIKSLIGARNKNVIIDTLMAKMEALIVSNNALQEEHSIVVARNEYLERVQATTFKAISYLTMSSKLPVEDKLIIQTDINKLSEGIPSLLVAPAPAPVVAPKDSALHTIVDGVVEANKETIVAVVGGAIAQTTNLIAKYVGK